MDIGFALNFFFDPVAWVFCLIFLVVGGLTLLYSFPYMKEAEHKLDYYFSFLLMIISLVTISFAANLLLIYVLWEIVAFCTWRLVGFYREPRHVFIADKTFLMTFFGSCLMLVGFILIYKETGTFNLLEIKGSSVKHFTLLLIFTGIIAKSASIPLHSWLSDAHTAAPTPMSAILSALVAKLGILGFVRIFMQTYAYQGNWILILAAISSLTAAGAALREKNMKRIIAYSTVSQLGYIFLGLGLLNLLGTMAGLLYFMFHGLAKAGLFLAVGIVKYKTGEEEDIGKLGGLMKTMPLTGIGFLFCSLSIMGLPPFAGFYPKLMTIMALVQEGHYWIAFFAILIAIMTILYLMRIFHAIFLGESKIEAREGSSLMVSIVLILGILSLALGLFINTPLNLVNAATNLIIK